MGTNLVLRWFPFGCAFLLASYEIIRAPFILGATSIVVIGSFLFGLRRDGTGRQQRRNRQRTAIETSALLSTGLWVGVFFVLRAADAGESSVVSEIPVGFSGQEIPILGVLVHGLISTTGIVSLLVVVYLFTGAYRSNSTGGRRGKRSSRYERPLRDVPPPSDPL